MAKKKKVAEGEAGAEQVSGTKPPSKPKTMLTGAVLVMIGALGYKFLLAGTPTQTVLVSAPVDAVMGAAGTAHGEADCSSMDAEADPAVTQDSKPHARAGGGASAGTVTLSEMTINLADADSARYIKVGIALELGKDVVAEEFEADKAKAADVAVRYFSQKKAAELQGPTAIETAKKELTCLVQAAYAEPVDPEAKKPAKPVAPKVAAVLFTQFLMQ